MILSVGFLQRLFFATMPSQGLKRKKKKKNASSCHPMGAKKLSTCCDSACKPNCIRHDPFKLIDSRTGVNIPIAVTLWCVTSSIKPLQVIFLSPGQRADLPEVPLDGLEHVHHLLTDATKYTVAVLGWTIHSAMRQISYVVYYYCHMSVFFVFLKVNTYSLMLLPMCTFGATFPVSCRRKDAK